MKCKVMQANAMLYPQPKAEGPTLRILHQGDLLELGRVKKAGSEQWLDVTLPDGTRGFMPGKTLLFAMKRVVTTQPETQLYSTPGREAPKATLKKGTTLDLQGAVEQNGEKWVEVRDQAGNTGYLDGKTKIQQVAKPSRARGIYNIVIGAIATLFGAFLLLGMIGSPFDLKEFLILMTWLAGGLSWLTYGIAMVVAASKS